MDNPSSPYPDEQHARQPGQAQECEMLYDYPHTADFPQADDYQPTQQLHVAPTEVDARQAGYADRLQTSYLNHADTQQAGYAGYTNTRRPFFAWAWKSWNSLWIVLTALALILLVAAGGFYYYLQVQSTPAKTLQTYCSAVKNDDGQALYNTYSNEAQSQTDQVHLQQALRLIEFFSGGIEDCTVDVGSIHETDPEATARVTFLLYNGRLSSTLLHLINEHGYWRIQNNTIVP
ncbi:MAG TPA: hypothetical protein VGD98_02965 [Ktedonobacteraceae bacterium]